MRTIKRVLLVGLSIGLVVCAIGWIVERRAGPPPTGSDPLMASAIIFEIGAAPLSFLTAGVVYRAKQAFDDGLAWRLLDSAQVLLNWLLLSLLVGLLLEYVVVRRQSSA